ncbi:MAG: glucosidase [Pirellulaceae bacterium]|nr:glucosidase [Pirellulaceae bacterium]
MASELTAEELRLVASNNRVENWQRWGSYLSERQWGTVREDYSGNQEAWNYFPHDHARSRAYRWGEDGLLGICDRECRLCFSFAFWNTRDDILKERLFGLSGPEGNHGEDVKEVYFYVDATPTHSYMKAVYKYPQCKFPYEQLTSENRRRNRLEPELELRDLGVFDQRNYFDCEIEYAKKSPDDILIRATIYNRSAQPAAIHVLPQWWFRNTWTWDCTHEGCAPKPTIRVQGDQLVAMHSTLEKWFMRSDVSSDGEPPVYLFTDNETNPQRHPGVPTTGEQHFKDAFHSYVVEGIVQSVNSQQMGTKVAAHTIHLIPAGKSVTIQARMCSASQAPETWFGPAFDEIFALRKSEADTFYAKHIPQTLAAEQQTVARQAYAGLLWTKQFYHYVVDAWLDGDSAGPSVPESRAHGRNHDWRHLFNRDIISMPDKWEYPWYAAWDLAFHMLPMARIDANFAKEQLVLFLREWYMHPNGELPAYEWALSDVNPPVHAWACWNTYLMSAPEGQRDREFLKRTFQKLLINFTWWVNRKDLEGHHIFSGGFLGLDNIGVFDRSKPLPGGGSLHQADATAWMAFYCGHMLRIALELAEESVAYADMASKFLEHYMAIADATNSLHGTGLWDEADGFYYDHLLSGGRSTPIKVRSLVGLIPMCAPVVLDERKIDRLPGFKKRTQWYLNNRTDMAKQMTYLNRVCPDGDYGLRLLALPNLERLQRMLQKMLDENEFLSPYGIRSLSAKHRTEPFVMNCNGEHMEVRYVPGESDTYMFGGNSNWRGPVWFPINYLLIESLRTYYQFYGDTLQVECPTGSGRMCNLSEVADEIQNRLIQLFTANGDGVRPCQAHDARFAHDPAWRDLVLFYEYFHGDNGSGLGASHQTGWTALVATLLEQQGGR